MSDQDEKVRAALEALELQQLAQLVKRVNAGEDIGGEDAKLMRQLRARYEKISTTAAPPSTPKKRGGLSWKTLAQVQDELGPSPTYLREAIGHAVHPLEYKQIGGKWCVQKNAVKDWIRLHGGRRAPKLKEPLDYEGEETGDRGQETGDKKAALIPLDVLAILESVNTDGGGESGVELEKLKIAKAEALRRHIDSEIARQKLFKADDVVKMLRSLGEVYCETVEAQANAQAADLIKIVRERMDVNLLEYFSGALLVLSQALCDQANRLVIPAIRREIGNQVEGVQMLEGVV